MAELTPENVAFILDIVKRVNDTLQDMHDCNTGTATGGPNGDGYYPIRDLSGVSHLQISPAKLASLVPTGQPIDLPIACFAEQSLVRAGTRIRPIRASRQMNIASVRGSLTSIDTSEPSTQGIRVDVLVNGVSMLSSPLIIYPGKLTSKAAGTPQAVISKPNIPDDAEITINVLNAGLNARGLTVTLIGNYV